MGVPDSLSADHVNEDRGRCALITMVEVGNCDDLRLNAKREEKLSKYEPLMMELRKEPDSASLLSRAPAKRLTRGILVLAIYRLLHGTIMARNKK
eukprot:scaffold71268_cov27-Prasinocladus_malaysianus.AAC.1